MPELPPSIVAARTHAHQPGEARRVAEVEAFQTPGLQNGAQHAALDSVVQQVCTLLRVPASVVSIVSGDQLVFRARRGVDIAGSRRDISFCTHVVARRAPLVVNDTVNDAFFQSNPLVTSGMIGAYAGIPLVTSRDKVLGALCAVDSRAHRFQPGDLELLTMLASRVVAEVESLRNPDALERLVDASTNIYWTEAFRQLLAIESGRHARSHTPMVLGVLDRSASFAQLHFYLRPTDIAGYLPDGRICVLFPGTTAEYVRSMFAGDCAGLEVFEHHPEFEGPVSCRRELAASQAILAA